MFIANTASVGHRIKLPEFVSHYFTGSTSTGTLAAINPYSVISGLENGDMLIVCSTVSNSGLSTTALPDLPTSSTGGPTWNNLLTVYSNDTTDSNTRVSYAIHNGNSYTIDLSSSYAVQIHQLLAFRNVSTVTSLNSGASYNVADVNFPSLFPGNISEAGILQFGGGGQYYAPFIGSYPDPGVYDYFYNYLVGTGGYANGLVGFGFYNPETFTTTIPSVIWSGAAYNSSRSSTFDITLMLQK